MEAGFPPREPAGQRGRRPAKFKDAFNTLNPSQDRTVQPVVDKVYDPILPKLIQQVYGVPAPKTPRNDLAEIYLTGICKACGPIKANLNAHRLNKDAPLEDRPGGGAAPEHGGAAHREAPAPRSARRRPGRLPDDSAWPTT
ncbi:hypothetical protein SMICM304S_01520 [Streptomyces microflavus]